MDADILFVDEQPGDREDRVGRPFVGPAGLIFDKALSEAGIREKTKVIIGGAPITQRYADEIGADGYTDNASGAVSLVRRLTGTATAA